jgi:flagellin
LIPQVPEGYPYSLICGAENMQASESRIRDTDMAEQMVEYVKNQILIQFSMSMLAQANIKPQTVLELMPWSEE